MTEDIARWGYNPEEIEALDDWASSWAKCREEGGVWGGRAQGGRGVRKITGEVPDIVVEGVSLQFAGKTLLGRTTLRFLRGHRYALIGKNGSGKSTLLRRMAKGLVPGMPTHLKVVYLQQELPTIPGITAIDFLKRGVNHSDGPEAEIEDLRDEEADLEAKLDCEGLSNEEIEVLANKLCEITEQIERLELQQKDGNNVSDSTNENLVRGFNEKSINVLRGLGLIKKVKTVLSAPVAQSSSTKNASKSSKDNKKSSSKPASTSNKASTDTTATTAVQQYEWLPVALSPMAVLSGGWRMRVSLAISLINSFRSDVLLLDEATNHLDLPCIMWLQDFLAKETEHLILIMVSHDSFFMDAVATDIVELKDEALKYFNGGYSEFLNNQSEMQHFQQNRLDSQSRKEEHLKKAIENAKSRGDSGASAAKSQTKKLNRVYMHRSLDGKKFKLFSLKKMSEDYLRTPEFLASEPTGAAKIEQKSGFKFPAPDVAALRLVSNDTNILSMDRCSIEYMTQPNSTTNTKVILRDVSFAITIKSRIAIVGPNGQGKSTLLASLLPDDFQHSIASVFDFVSTRKPNTSNASTIANPTENTAAVVETTKQPTSNVTTSMTSTNRPVKIITTSSNKNARGSTASTEEEIPVTVRQPNLVIRGVFHQHHNLKVGLVTQHHIDLIEKHVHETPLELITTIVDYMVQQSVTSNVTSSNVTDVRQHLGSFGLSGKTALQPIGSLSGGQKARLAFAIVCLTKPHLLLLDEPSNNLSIEATVHLAQACKDFAGAIVMVSHNQSLLTECCTELCVVDNGTAYIKRSTAPVNSAPVATASKSSSKSNAQAVSSLTAQTTMGEESFEDILSSYLEEVLGDN